MKYIKVKTEDRINHILLDRGRSNSMDMTMIEELTDVIQESDRREDIEGIVLHGKEGFFSSGLDLIALYDYDEEQILSFWHKFMHLVDKLTAFKKPAIAAISGHSPAGGCVLALCCDYRVMCKGEYVIGLNEVPVGIIVPKAIFELYSFWVGHANAYRSLLTGRLMGPEEALKIGLVDELTESNKIQTVTSQRIKMFTQFEKHTWKSSKVNLRQNLLLKMKEDREESIAQILEQWWKPSTRNILKTIINNLKSK